MLHFSEEKVCICGLAEVLIPQNTKKYSQIENPQSATLTEGSQILQIIEARKFPDLRFAELIYGTAYLC